MDEQVKTSDRNEKVRISAEDHLTLVRKQAEPLVKARKDRQKQANKVAKELTDLGFSEATVKFLTGVDIVS